MTAARVKLEGLDSTQAAAQNALQGMSTGQDASQHSFMTQWQAAMQEYYKTQAQQSPGFGGGMSYPGLWGSQPFLAAYGGMPFYGGSMVANPYAMLNSPTQAAAAGVPDLSNAQPAQTNPGAAQPTSTQPSNDASKAHSNDNTSSDMDEHPADTDHSAQRNTGATQPLGGSMAPANGEGAGAPVAIAVPQMLNPLAATSPHPSPMALEAFRSAMSPQVASQFPNDQAMDQQFPLDERELKRQRRKQSNRESARRSRLRKQAETEELARTVKDLNSEVGSVKQVTDQLRALVEKLDKEKSQLIQQVRSLGGVVDPALEQPISLALPPSAPSTTLPPATTMAAPGSQGPTAAGPPQAKQGVPGFNPASAQLPVSFPVAVPMQGAMPQMMSETTQQVNNILANTALANKGQVPTGLAAVSASANMATLPGTNRAALPLSVHPMFQMAQQPATMLTQPEGLQMAAGHYLSSAQAMRSFTTAMAAAVGDNPSAAQYLGSASALTNPMLSVEGLSLPNIASLQGGLAQLSGSLNSSGAFAVQNGAQLSSWGLPLSSSVPAGSAGGVSMGAQPTLSQELAAASAPVAPMPIGVPNESEMTAALASEPLVMSQGANEGDPYGLNQPQSAMEQDPLPQVPQGHFMAELQEIGVAQEQPQQEEDKGQWVVDDAVQPGDGDGGLEFNEDVSPGDGVQELGHGQQEDSGADQVVGGDDQEAQKGEEGEREVEEQDDDYEGDLGFPDEEGDHQD